MCGKAEVRRRLQSGNEGAAGDDNGGDIGGERVVALVCYGLGSVQRCVG